MSDAGAPRYLYGVVRSGTVKGPPDGIDGRPVEEMAAGRIAALTSVVGPGEIQPTRDRLGAHLRVLQVVGERTTVVPMRFGMVAQGADEVRRRFLEPRDDTLWSLLRELEGMVEMDVKASYREEAVLAEIVRERRDIRRLDERIRSRPGDASYYDRVRLGELVVAAMREKAEREGRDLLRRLTSSAARAQAGPVSGERMVLNAAFLVERRAVDDFELEVARVERERAQRLRVRSIGPLPPSSFASLDAPPERRRWRGR